MTQKQLMEKLEQNEPATITTVTEWLCSLLKTAERPEMIECPKCGEEVML